MNEANGTVNFRVGVIEGNLAAPVTINFSTSDGSAIGKCMHEDHNYILFTCTDSLSPSDLCKHVPLSYNYDLLSRIL